MEGGAASVLSRQVGAEATASGASAALARTPRGPDRAPRRTGGPWLGVGRIVVVLVGLLVPLVIAELAFRHAGALAPGEYQTADLNAASDIYGRQNLANRAGWKKSSEFTTHVRVNSSGLRGPEIPYSKPAATYRVLVLGDSFTFGAQVHEEETFVSRLERYLERGAARAGLDGRRIQTINAGVDGWSTINALAWLKTEGVRYAPDLVVLMFYTGNDPGENFDRMKAVKRIAGPSEPTSGLPAPEVRRWLAQSSALYAVVESGVVAKLQPAPEPDDRPDPSLLNVRRSADGDRKQRGWELSATLLRQLREHCDERNVGLLVVGIPTVEHVANADRPPTSIRPIGADAGASVVDLLDTFRSASAASPSPLYYPRDKHWTALGHDLAADHVAGELIGRGYLTDRPRPN